MAFALSFHYLSWNYNAIADGQSCLSKVEELCETNVSFTAQIIDLELKRVIEEQACDDHIRQIKGDILLNPKSVNDCVLIGEIVYLKPTKNNDCIRF